VGHKKTVVIGFQSYCVVEKQVFTAKISFETETKIINRGYLLSDRQQRILDLLGKSGPRLHRLLTQLTLCEQTAGDLMQELFIKLANSSAVDDVENLYAYTWRAAVNLAFDWRRNHRPTLPLDESLLPPDKSPSTLDCMIQAEQLNQVLNEVSKLNELGRTVIVMRYIEQMPYEKIAKSLNKDPNHIRSLCSKVIALLRNRLSEPKEADNV